MQTVQPCRKSFESECGAAEAAPLQGCQPVREQKVKNPTLFAKNANKGGMTCNCGYLLDSSTEGF